MTKKEKSEAFLKNFRIECAKKGTSPTKVMKSIGLSTGFPTIWAKKGSVPTIDNTQLIADFLEIAVSKLMPWVSVGLAVPNDAVSETTDAVTIDLSAAFISAKNETIAELRARLAEVNAAKDETIASLKRENGMLCEWLADKNKIIEELERELGRDKKDGGLTRSA